MLIKTQVLRVNSEYGILPLQMFFYITNNGNQTLMRSTIAKVNCFRILFKHSQPRYVLKIECGTKNLPEYAKTQIKLHALSSILELIGCDERRMNIKLC